jgi:hypothetical protein
MSHPEFEDESRMGSEEAGNSDLREGHEVDEGVSAGADALQGSDRGWTVSRAASVARTQRRFANAIVVRAPGSPTRANGANGSCGSNGSGCLGFSKYGC